MGNTTAKNSSEEVSNAEVLSAVKEMHAAMNNYSQVIEKRFDGMDQRFDQVNKRFDRVETRLDDVEGRLGNVEKRMDDMQGSIDYLVTTTEKIQAEQSLMSMTLHRHERRIEKNEKDIVHTQMMFRSMPNSPSAS